MLIHLDDGVDGLAELTELLVQASPGPLKVTRAAARRYTVATSTGRQVASVGRESDAHLFARAQLGIRVLATVVAEVLASHRAEDGWCTQCRQADPCATRRIILAELGSLSANA